MHKDNLYTIGALAKEAGISSQTLRYYEKTGLLTPSFIDEKTQYRYYSQKELFQILAIRYYKYLNFSLKEIKEFLDLKEIDSIESFYKQKIQKLKIQIRKLKHSTQLLTQCGKSIKNASNQTTSPTPAIKNFPERLILGVRKRLPFTFQSRLKLFNQLTRFLYQHHLPTKNSFHHAFYSAYSEISGSPADLEIFMELTALPKIFLTQPATRKYFHTFPPGPYLVFTQKGINTENYSQQHAFFETWALSQGYTLSTPVIHFYLISQAEIKDPEKVLFQYQIPLIPKA